MRGGVAGVPASVPEVARGVLMHAVRARTNPKAAPAAKQAAKKRKQQQVASSTGAGAESDAAPPASHGAPATLHQQATRRALVSMVGLPHSGLFPYAQKHVHRSPENITAIEQIIRDASRLTFEPSGLNCEMTVHVEGEPVTFAEGTIWVPASTAQRFDVCQNQIQGGALEGVGDLSSTFYCGNKSLPCPCGIQFAPTPYTLKVHSDQTAVWRQTDGAKADKETREQALARRLKQLPKVIGSGGTEILAQITAVSGRWMEVQPVGDVRASDLSIPPGWAHAFLERGPWRGNAKLATLAKTYDVALTIDQYYVPDGGDGDGGFWILADVTGSIKKAQLVGIWLTVAFLPSMGLPKLPHRVTAQPPKPVIDALGAEAVEAMSAAGATAKAGGGEADGPNKTAGAYWSVESGAKRSRKSKAAMRSGATMM